MDHETESKPATVVAIEPRQVPGWPDDLPTVAKFVSKHMTAMREEGLARQAAAAEAAVASATDEAVADEPQPGEPAK